MLADLLKANGHELALNLLDVGAVPLDSEPEPYQRLLATFPSSRLDAFELDAALCEKLNREAAPNVRYHCCALGRTEEKRTLYNTRHPMCTSLYPPDERLADLYGNLDMVRLESTSAIDTVSLDRFAREQALSPPDFVKIDVQGAELEILQGGASCLSNVLLVVCEVEFIPIYRGQPLYGDVAAWLGARGLLLNKFLGMAGRVLKPFALHGSTGYPAQFMWTDAVFVRDLTAADSLTAIQLLKLAVLLDTYESCDAAHHLLRCYDRREDDDMADIYLAELKKAGVWTVAQQGKD